MVSENHRPGQGRRARLAILLSGRGSNFLALKRAIDDRRLDADIALVLSNVPDAPGLRAARDLGLPTVAISHRGLSRGEHDRQVAESVASAEADWVCLAGYMRVLGKELVGRYRHRIVNIHPSLLPAFPGLDAQAQAWEYGVQVTGATVHLVDEGLDTGPIVAQKAVRVDSSSSAVDLAASILEVEHRLYPETLQRLLVEPWTLRGRTVLFQRPEIEDETERKKL